MEWCHARIIGLIHVSAVRNEQSNQINGLVLDSDVQSRPSGTGSGRYPFGICSARQKHLDRQPIASDDGAA
jgi:hypothetical protein